MPLDYLHGRMVEAIKDERHQDAERLAEIILNYFHSKRAPVEPPKGEGEAWRPFKTYLGFDPDDV